MAYNCPRKQEGLAMKRWAIVGLGVIVGLSVASVAQITWQLPRGEATNSGFASLPLRPPLAVLWTFIPSEPARLNRFPLTHDGERAFLVTANNLYALSLVDGQPRENWRATNLPYLLTTPPILAGGRVFVGTSQGEVLAFDPETGAPLEGIALQQTAINALGTYGDYLFVGTSDGFVHWAPLSHLTDLQSLRLSSPIATNFAFIPFKDEAVICVGTASRLFFLRLTKEGERVRLRELARPLPPAGGSLTDPVYDPATRTVYVGAGETLARYSPLGQPMNPVRLKGSIEGAPVIAPDGTVFVGTDAGMVYALSPRTLSLRWQQRLPSAIQAPLLCTGESLWVATFDGLLSGLEAKTGEIRWHFRLGDVNPNFVSVSVSAPLVAAPFGLVVVDTAGRAYAFTDANCVHDGTPPAFYDATLQLLSAERQVVGYRLFDDAVAQETPAIPGRPPIYLRVRVADRETGVNEKTLKAQLIALRRRPLQVTDLTGTFKATTGEWTVHVHVDRTSEKSPRQVVRVIAPLPDGEYLVVLQASDYAGNTARRAFAFRVDNTLPPPRLQAMQPTAGAPGAQGVPAPPGAPGAPGGPGGY